MANINDPIQYDWKLGWEGVSEPYPKVSRLLKAVLDRDIVVMDRLVEQGASLKASDKTTLMRIIFHVIDSYPVMKWLVSNGVSRIGQDLDVNGNNGINDNNCISPSGYLWGLSARAYYLKAYDVMDLLCSHGFDDFGCFDEGWSKTWYADRHILSNGDEKAIRILLENGYFFSEFGDERYYYEKYVLNRPQVVRKTVGLDSSKFKREVPTPRYEDVPLIWGKKETQRRNSRRREDYEDRVRAHNKFVASFGMGNMNKYVKEKEQFDKEFNELMEEMLKSGEI